MSSKAGVIKSIYVRDVFFPQETMAGKPYQLWAGEILPTISVETKTRRGWQAADGSELL